MLFWYISAIDDFIDLCFHLVAVVFSLGGMKLVKLRCFI